MACVHEEFESVVDVIRIQSFEGGPVTGYAAEVHVECAHCGEVFVFLGLPGGLHPERPTCSVVGDEARLPIRPSSEVWPQNTQKVTAEAEAPALRRIPPPLRGEALSRALRQIYEDAVRIPMLRDERKERPG